MSGSFDLTRVGTAGKRIVLPPPAEALTQSPSAGPHIQLAPPRHVPRLTEELAASSLKLEWDAVAQLDVLVAEFILGVSRLSERSPELQERRKEVQSLGGDRADADAALTLQPLLVRPSGPLTNGGPSAQVGDLLLALCSHSDNLNPHHQDDLASGPKAFGNYLNRYRRSQGDLGVVIQSLETLEGELRKDAFDLAKHRDGIATRMEELRPSQYVAEKLRVILADRSAKWQEIDPDRARVFEILLEDASDRSSRLGVELALYVQAYMTAEAIQANATELARGLARARTATLVALRTAVEGGRALVDPKFELNLIPAVNTVERSALPVPAGGAGEEPGTIKYEVARLYAAFDELVSTTAEVDAWRALSVDAMSSLAYSLQSQLRRAAKPQS